jgi:hypothetical protein
MIDHRLLISLYFLFFLVLEDYLMEFRNYSVVIFLGLRGLHKLHLQGLQRHCHTQSLQQPISPFHPKGKSKINPSSLLQRYDCINIIGISKISNIIVDAVDEDPGCLCISILFTFRV